MRGRGLKQRRIHERLQLRKVAPHAGAWIETSYPHNLTGYPHVAPHAGAWIETAQQKVRPACPKVAPHAGAWIETCQQILTFFLILSPPMRGRGLKQRPAVGQKTKAGRPPCGGVD